jgi:hypothetical protein
MNDFTTKKGAALEAESRLMANPAVDVDTVPETELAEALASFRESVHAWSDAEFNRPRKLRVAAHSTWRAVLAWALGCMVVAGGVSGGIYDHHRNVVERQAAAARIEQQRKLAEQQKQQAAVNPPANDDSLMANVDSDVSRTVPAAMEPLAQLMEDDGTN